MVIRDRNRNRKGRGGGRATQGREVLLCLLCPSPLSVGQRGGGRHDSVLSEAIFTLGWRCERVHDGGSHERR